MTADRTYTPVPIRPALRCSWFHWCDRVAVYFVSHPVLDYVPTCARCADRIRRADTEGGGR